MKGILGGTFDPVHRGHLYIARQARDLLGVPVHLVLSARPWHRDAPVCSIEHRYAMLRLAVRGEPGLVASDVEVSRPGPSYAVDTLRAMRRDDEPMVWILGRDAYAQITQWNRFEELPSLAHLCVFEREDAPPATEPPGFRRARSVCELRADASGLVLHHGAMPPAISSTGVRCVLRQRGASDALVTQSVREYIEQHELYL